MFKNINISNVFFTIDLLSSYNSLRSYLRLRQPFQKRYRCTIIFHIGHYICQQRLSRLIGLEWFGLGKVKRHLSFFNAIKFLRNLSKIISCNSNILPVRHPLILRNHSIMIKIHLSHQNVITALTVAGEVLIDCLTIDYLFIFQRDFVKDVICFLECLMSNLRMRGKCTCALDWKQQPPILYVCVCKVNINYYANTDY